jgi:hypothetical protein
MAQGRHTAITIQLTTDERQTLERWQRSAHIPARRARRGRMILLLADGVPLSQIADIVEGTRHSVYKWAARFLAEGLAGLADKPRGVAPAASRRALRQGSAGGPEPCRACRPRRCGSQAVTLRVAQRSCPADGPA